MTDSSGNLLTCSNQRNQRKLFFFFEGANNVRFNITSPYIYDSSGNLVYTQQQLNMRRKAEILKYIRPEQNKVRKNRYSQLVTQGNKQVTRTICNNTNIWIPTSSSDVPGPVIYLSEDPTVPLYNYYSDDSQFQFQDIPYDNYKRSFDIFSNKDTAMKNLVPIGFSAIVILTPNVTELPFNFSLPMNIQFNGHYTISSAADAVTTINLGIYSARLDIYYSETLIQSINATYRSNTAKDTDIASSTNTISIDLTNSANGKIATSQYVGNLLFENVILPSVTQYVYSCKLTIGISYAEYNNTNVGRSNINGNGIGSNNEINVTQVDFNPFLNIDSNNNPQYQTETNCDVTIYTNKIGVTDPEVTDITFIPLSIYSPFVSS